MAERGRPPFKATPALKRKVEELICCGMAKEAVARAIGCDVDTLKKHFGEELETGTAKKRAEIIGMLFKAARAGNVTAQKKREEMNRLATAEQVFDKPTERPAKLGKKDEAQIAAQSAGEDSDWGSDLKTPTVQ